MLQKKHLILISLATSTLFFTACTPTSAPTLQPSPVKVTEHIPTTPVAQNEPGLDLSQKSPTFHSGMNAGCSTAKGKYSKDSARFSGEADYKEGWFYGRRKCQAHKAV